MKLCINPCANTLNTSTFMACVILLMSGCPILTSFHLCFSVFFFFEHNNDLILLFLMTEQKAKLNLHKLLTEMIRNIPKVVVQDWTVKYFLILWKYTYKWECCWNLPTWETCWVAWLMNTWCEINTKLSPNGCGWSVRSQCEIAEPSQAWLWSKRNTWVTSLWERKRLLMFFATVLSYL